MKKISLAAALVALAAPAFAQSTVSIYGRINTTVEHQKLGTQSMTALADNSSRIGFQGVEDLGNGLKAGFILESGFNSDTGTGAGNAGLSFNRQSELNLAGGWGMLRLGNFTSESYFATADAISMHNHDTGSSSDALYAWVTRDTNKISYRTPTFANTWVEVAHAFHERQVDNAGDPLKNTWDLAANHSGANYALGAGFTDNGYDRQLAVRASYTLQQLVLGAYVQRVELADRAGGATEKWNNYRLAAAYTLGANELHANVGYADRDRGQSAKQWTLGVNHNLSKRTKLYALYTKVANSSNASYGYGFNDSLQRAAGSATGADFSAFAVGIRHQF